MAPFRRAGLTSQPSDSEVEHIIPSIVGGGTGGEQAQAQMGGLALEGANMAAAAGSTILMDEEGGAMGVNSSIHASDRKSMSIKSKKVERKSAATRSADDEGEGDDNDDSSSNNERTSLLGRQPKQPWYRRPHPAYMHTCMFLMAIGMGVLAAAKIEQFTQAICGQVNEDILLSHPELDPVSDFDKLHSILLATPEQCRHNTTVQKKVAELNALINVIMGVSCVITTSYWGALSDRIGRKVCLALNTLSFVFGDIILVMVLSFPDRIGYFWLLAYPLLEGLFGGMGGGQSIMSAYIGDCTAAGSRSGTFSIMIGVVFGGIAVGPAIGSLTIQATGNALAPFYVALVVHFLQTLVTIFIMPESLSKDKQADARQAYNDNKVKKQELAREDAWIAQREGYGRPRRVWIAIKAIFRPVLSIFAPLALLGPTPKTGGGWDWSLPVLAVTTGFYTMMMSIYSVKMQYAQLKFGWSSIQLGNFLTLMGLTRIVALCVAIPLLIKLIRKPHKEPLREAPSADVPESLREERQSHANASGFSRVEDEEWESHKSQHRLIHDYQFDLRLARMSVVIDIISYTALCFNKDVTQFILFVMLQALAAGANPALSSLCLMFADPKETGSLMGALGVLQILFSQVAGPVLFSSIYASTVDTWPEAIFLLGAGIFTIALVGLFLVKVRRPKWNGYSTEANEGEPAISDITATAA